MTKHAKEKMAAKNRKKSQGKSRVTLEELEQRESEIRRQIAQANRDYAEKDAAMQEEWDYWCAWYNQYTIPRLSVGFYWAALEIIDKYLVGASKDAFMDDLSSQMQSVINDASGDGDGMEAFNQYADRLKEAGYDVPTWAEVEDVEHIKELITENRKRQKEKKQQQ